MESKRGHFKGVRTWMHRDKGQGWLKAKTSLLLKKLCAACDQHLGIYGGSTCEVTFHGTPFLSRVRHR